MDTLAHGKVCSKCGKWKAFDQFHRNPDGVYGLRAKCKECYNVQRRIERIEQGDALRQTEQQRRDINRDRIREHHRNYMRAWAKANPEKTFTGMRKHYTTRRNTTGTFTTAEWRKLCSTYGDRCLCCEKQCSLEADHIVPVSRGGKNTIDNLQPLCRSCNAIKGTKIIDYRKELV